MTRNKLLQQIIQEIYIQPGKSPVKYNVKMASVVLKNPIAQSTYFKDMVHWML